MAWMRAEKDARRRAIRGTGAANELVVNQMPRVHSMARKLARRLPSYVSLDDLVSAGTLGLVHAARRYDPALCNRFEAFAEHRIKGAMLDELRAHDCLSRDLRAHCRRRDEAVATLEQALGRSPTPTEVAGEMGMEIEEYQELLGRAHRGHVSSAEALSHDGAGAQAYADTECPDPCDVAIARERLELLAKAVAALPERLQLVTSLYYREGLTLAQIGEMLGVTEARACQLRGEAVRRMRQTLDEIEHVAA
jgi:RNA polymerase sigma factor for flagellar operon FliA